MKKMISLFLLFALICMLPACGKAESPTPTAITEAKELTESMVTQTKEISLSLQNMDDYLEYSATMKNGAPYHPYSGLDMTLGHLYVDCAYSFQGNPHYKYKNVEINLLLSYFTEDWQEVIVEQQYTVSLNLAGNGKGNLILTVNPPNGNQGEQWWKDIYIQNASLDEAQYTVITIIGISGAVEEYGT